MQIDPFTAENAGTSEVTYIDGPDENIVIGAPTDTAPTDAGTEVADLTESSELITTGRDV